jgi:hypothetical protein
MSLVLPGQPAPPAPEQVQVVHTESVVGPDGRLYALRVEGTAELTRGPLGRFIDLAERIESEGLVVPAEIRAVLDQLIEGDQK